MMELSMAEMLLVRATELVQQVKFVKDKVEGLNIFERKLMVFSDPGVWFNDIGMVATDEQTAHRYCL